MFCENGLESYTATNLQFDKNISEEMIIDDINEGLGFTTPSRGDKPEQTPSTPCTQIYRKFVDLNVISTPKTSKEPCQKG